MQVHPSTSSVAKRISTVSKLGFHSHTWLLWEGNPWKLLIIAHTPGWVIRSRGLQSEGGLHTQFISLKKPSTKQLANKAQAPAASEGPEWCGFVKATSQITGKKNLLPALEESSSKPHRNQNCIVNTELVGFWQVCEKLVLPDWGPKPNSDTYKNAPSRVRSQTSNGRRFKNVFRYSSQN